MSSAAADVAEITPADVPAVAQFLAREGDAPSPIASDVVERRLVWRLLDNPARTAEIPLGWMLRTAAGEIVGIHLCVPQRFVCGESEYKLVLSAAYFIVSEYRGIGLQLFLRYLQLGRRFGLYATTANANSAALWRRFGAMPVEGTDAEWLVVLRPGPLVEEVTMRRFGRSGFARAAGVILGPLAGLANRVRLPEAGEAMELDPQAAPDFVQPQAGCLAAVRDAAWFDWRYRHPAAGDCQLYGFRGTRDFVALGIQRRGYRGQVRAANVLDLTLAQPSTVPDVLAVVRARVQKRADVLVMRCLNPATAAAVEAVGAQRRPFAQPIGWVIDRHGVLPRVPLRLGFGDGDMA